MATNTLPTFRAHLQASPLEPQFVVSYPHEGSTYVVGFDSFNDLLHKLTSYRNADGDYLDGEIINRIVDFSEESLEWSQPEYPLMQPADAACDYDGPEYDPRTVAFRRSAPSPFWGWAAASLRVGAVVAPWVAALIVGRWWWGR